MNIQFLDLKSQYKTIKPEIDIAIQNVLDRCNFIMGDDVKELEKEIAAYCGTKFAISCASGTDALILSLMACGIGEEDEVITTPFTFIATTEAISKLRARITFVDIDPETYNIDPVKIEEYIQQNCEFKQLEQFQQIEQAEQSKRLINKNTGKIVKAILPVHLYGHPADMDPIMEIAKKYNLRVIEDCAQAIGAEYTSSTHATMDDGRPLPAVARTMDDSINPQSITSNPQNTDLSLRGALCNRDATKQSQTLQPRKVGSIGDAGCLSFFPSKNLGCYGDGGMVVTNNEKIAEKVRMLRVHGCKTKYYHEIDGYNSRLDTIQAAVLRVKLKYLDSWNNSRREKMLHYNELFEIAANKAQLPLGKVTKDVGRGTWECGAKRSLPEGGCGAKRSLPEGGCGAERSLPEGYDSNNTRHCEAPCVSKRAEAISNESLKLTAYGLQLPLEANYARHVAYAYTIRAQRRNELQTYLKEQGIPSMIYYPVPLHLQKVCESLNYKPGDFPVSERLSDEVLSLPIYPELTNEQQEYIVNSVVEFYTKKEATVGTDTY